MLKRKLPSIHKGSLTGKLIAAFLCAIATLLAQDATTAYMNPNVLRVGQKLACRCGGCRNTVGSCPMLHCEYSDPMRHRIEGMQAKGESDQQIVNTIVGEQGIVALSSPTGEGWGLFTWVMPGIAALIGFLIYSAYVKRNRKPVPEPMTAADHEVLQRFHEQIESELEDTPQNSGKAVDKRT